MVHVDRLEPYQASVIDGTYYVQVTNEGCEATSDLRVVTAFQGLGADGSWVDVEEFEIAHSLVLQPGECAVFEAPVSFVSNFTELRAITHATIDNFVGHMGQRYGAVSYDGMGSLERATAVLDDSGVLHDEIIVPDNYTHDDFEPIVVNGDATVEVSFLVTNVNSDEHANITNAAWLELPSGRIVRDDVTIATSSANGDEYPIRVEGTNLNIILERMATYDWTFSLTYLGNSTASIPLGQRAVLEFEAVLDSRYNSTGVGLHGYGAMWLWNRSNVTITGVRGTASFQGLDGSGRCVDIPGLNGDLYISESYILPGEAISASIDLTKNYETNTPYAMANYSKLRMYYEIEWDGGNLSGILSEAHLIGSSIYIHEKPYGSLTDINMILPYGLDYRILDYDRWIVNVSKTVTIRIEVTNYDASGTRNAHLEVWFMPHFGYSHRRTFDVAIDAG